MRKLAIVATLIMGLTSTLFSLNAQAAADRDALRAVDSYMAALVIGDTQKMASRMGQRMQAERGKILGNPSYSKTLQKAYAGAKFEVLNSTQLAEDRAAVTVRIILASKDMVHVRFELAGGPDYLIISES